MKTKEEVLNQMYMTAKDLKILIPTLGLEKCRKYIMEVQKEMKEKGYFVPESIPRLALTKFVKNKFNF